MATLLKPVNLKRLPVNRRLIAGLFLITGVVSLGLSLRGPGQRQPLVISYTVEQKSTPPQLPVPVKEKLAAASGEYSLWVYRLTEGVGYGVNEAAVMPAASIMKVPIMVAVYRAADRGQIALTDEVKGLLEASGKRSDNDAPLVLTQRVGREFVEQVMEQLGMEGSSFAANTTTAADVARMWAALYAEGREELWANLTSSIFEERIPAGVPEGTRVVHKVGTAAAVWADAGIVFAPQPFVLVILNKGVKLEEAKQVVPEVTRLIWEYETPD